MTEQSELLALADRVQTVIDRNDLVARDIKVLDKAIDAIRVHAQGASLQAEGVTTPCEQIPGAQHLYGTGEAEPVALSALLSDIADELEQNRRLVSNPILTAKTIGIALEKAAPPSAVLPDREALARELCRQDIPWNWQGKNREAWVEIQWRGYLKSADAILALSRPQLEAEIIERTKAELISRGTTTTDHSVVYASMTEVLHAVSAALKPEGK
jgi:hypothetical protein